MRVLEWGWIQLAYSSGPLSAVAARIRRDLVTARTFLADASPSAFGRCSTWIPPPSRAITALKARLLCVTDKQCQDRHAVSFWRC
jgi:hypothetical protein